MITMIKDIMNANDSATPNSREMAVLKENFPSCFKADGSFDIERFKEFLSDKIAVTGEGYELKFLGKNYARLLASIDTTTVVVPDEEHNSKPENMNSENIYISGDNLDALKHLLKSYSRKVKLIYIDPPYNTGTDGFVYNDNFKFTVEELSEKLSISEEQAQRILDLTKRGSASHSAWLMFMYSRLLLARDLLTTDGVIFISIDDNEQSNLKLLCDEVFGEQNFVEQIIWRKKSGGGQQDDYFVTEHDYIICIARDKVYFSLNEKTITKSSNSYNKVDPDTKKKFKKIKLAKWGSAAHKEDRPTMYFPIIDPDGNDNYPIAPDGRPGRWRYGKASIERLIAENKIIFEKINGEWVAYEKEYEPTEGDISILKERSIFYDLVENTSGAKELTELFGTKDVFDNPKPTDLLLHLSLLVFGEGERGIILDFFSGSASTAHAAIRLNVEYNRNIRFICIQIPDKLDSENSSQIKAFNFLIENNLPTTLDYIGMERIIRAAKAIKEDFPDTSSDLGFKHYTLVEPASDTLDKLEKFDPTENKLFADKDILSDFGKPTVLATWLVRDGYGLTADAEELNFAGYNGYYIGKHLYLIDPELSNKAIEAIVVKYETDGSFNPENVVLFGYSFTWTEMEALKINLKRLKDTEKNLRINFDIRY